MSIKKYIANKDSTITNAFKENLSTRAVNSNMGAADSLEIFSVYGQSTTSSIEKSRILIQFPIDSISSDRIAGLIPASGSVEYYLRLFNVVHPYSVPKNFSFSINPVSKSWEEGYGLDMENYLNDGFIELTGGTGVTWNSAASGSLWTTAGGDIINNQNYNYSYNFDNGLEDIELNITNLVEDWLSGVINNYGLLLKLSGSYEDGSQIKSFYTKKFSSRGSEFFYQRPCIEARWNPSITDDRNNFYASSSLFDSSDNKMNLYFYNKVSGKNKNIINNLIPDVKFYTNSNYSNEISASFLTCSNPLVGVYKANVSLNTTASVVYDKWYFDSIPIFSSSFYINSRLGHEYSYDDEIVVNIINLKSKYLQNEIAKFKIFIREFDWQPNIYSVASSNIENIIIPNLYYKIFRSNDNYSILNYSTGSLSYTKTSYDVNGNYFDLDMNIFEKNYTYGIKLAIWDGSELKELKNVYRFGVE